MRRRGGSDVAAADVQRRSLPDRGVFELGARRIVDSHFDIREGEKVLDVGCGGMPFPSATHLADVNLFDDSSRFGLRIPLGPRPVYECSVERMPFGDLAFDFVYCAHVLEHVDDPAAACRELMRVAPRGYLECPRSWTEIVFSALDHRWLVDLEGGVLVFREKLPSECGDPLGIRFAIFSWLEDPAFRRHWDSPATKSVRAVELYWEGRFEFLVVTREERERDPRRRRARPPIARAALRTMVAATPAVSGAA
jgi:SAM-dependent methyltransferase